MEPISLAVLTAAVTTLASKVAEGFAGEAGKSLWGKVKATLGWAAEPTSQELAPKLARQFDDDEAVARQVLELLKADQGSGGPAGVGQLVGQVQVGSGGKVVVIGSQVAQGNITNNF